MVILPQMAILLELFRKLSINIITLQLLSVSANRFDNYITHTERQYQIILFCKLIQIWGSHVEMAAGQLKNSQNKQQIFKYRSCVNVKYLKCPINFIKQIASIIIPHSMASKIPKLRQYYERVGRKVQSDPYDVKLATEVARYKSTALEEKQRMISKSQYEYLEEADFYLQKFTSMEQLIKDQTVNKLSSAEYSSRAKQLFAGKYVPPSQNMMTAQIGQQPTIPGNSQVQPLQPIYQPPQPNYQTPQPNYQPNYIHGIPANDSFRQSYGNDSFRQQNANDSQRRGVSPQRQALNKFFDSKIGPVPAFNSILERPNNLSPSNFKKKLRQLQQQNSLLKSQLSTGMNVAVSTVDRQILQQKYQHNKKQIRILQQQNSQLSRDNTKLRSQRRVSGITSIYEGDDYLYSPYTFPTRSNNIHQINMRNLSEQGYQFDASERDLSQHGPVPVPIRVKQQQVVHKTVGYEYGSYTEQDYANQRGVNFSIFDENRSAYSQNGDFSNVRKGIQSEKTAIRNKNVFFKTKGLLVRNDDIEIGMKRSQPDAQNAVRVILFFNNKNADYKMIRTNYEYEQDYYQVKVVEKISQLQSFRQGRQVVEVKLRGDRPDFNSVIDVKIFVGRDSYKLWLPAMFFRISKPNNLGPTTFDETSKTIYPSKPFKNPMDASRVIENLNVIGNDDAQFWVDSAKGSGLVKMTWKSEKGKLKLTTSKRWMDFLTFLMIDGS